MTGTTNLADESTTAAGFEIAVIGMAGRFPGAANLGEFWENLKNGIEAIAFSAGKEIGTENPGFVPCRGGMLEGIENFDASFFDYIPSEAEVMDPQVRFLHEVAWTALEDAGYGAGSYDGLIGLYAGAAANLDWGVRAYLAGKGEEIGKLVVQQLTDRDFFCSRVAYKLDLRGPALTIQTACSTSLTAVATAYRALLSGECDMALAGGVSIPGSEKTGYLYEEGMILSRDGHCRPFAAGSSGTVPGSGAGVVVLKPLEDARADRDHIYAVIKGAAINNDGSGKIGYTAPSVDGQAEVIEAALHLAEVSPESIGYVETHGTGTVLGDPIEIEALKQAFATDKRGFCALGAVKANIGHLDAAAGAAGFIKTVLALKHGLIPPQINFNAPNPKIDFANSPFYVNRVLQKWPRHSGPLRAGVSSFGIGGTNVHVVLEEAPDPGAGSPVKGESGSEREYRLLLLSARTEGALQRMRVGLAGYLKQHPAISLGDAAYTLQAGRKAFRYRKMWVCRNRAEAIENLLSEDLQRITAVVSKQDENRRIVFMFPGLGAQYVNMGRGLYESEPLFRREMDRCFEILKPLTDYDIKEVLYPGPKFGQSDRGDSSVASGNSGLHRFEVAQLAVFIFEYGLARLLMAWGIKPGAMIGYSFGEYAAACLAGVFSLEEALTLIVTRGALLEGLAPGRMLSVPLPAVELELLLNKDVSIAIDNGPSCVVAGAPGAVEAFEKRMQQKKIMCVRLPGTRALHSPLMAPVAAEFKRAAAKISQHQPQIPYISNVTGDWQRVKDARDPGYWVTHLQETVRFAGGIKKLVEKEKSVFIEVGPGNDLSALIVRHFEGSIGQPVINLSRNPQREVPDVYFLLNRIGALWLHGVPIDWQAFNAGAQRYRISLPAYSFEPQRCWLQGTPADLDRLGETFFSKTLPLHKRPDIGDWFYLPSWKRSGRVSRQTGLIFPGGDWLVFTLEDSRLGDRLINSLSQSGVQAIRVKPGLEFTSDEKERIYRIDPGDKHHYEALFRELQKLPQIPRTLLHLWNLGGGEGEELETDRVKRGLELGFYSLLHLVQALETLGWAGELRIKILTAGLQEFSGEEEIRPEISPLLGLVKVIPQEYPQIRCQAVDIVLPEPGGKNETGYVRRLLTLLAEDSPEAVTAYRGDHLWVPTFAPLNFTGRDRAGSMVSLVKPGGVYLITGGLGKIGFLLARHLARTLKARLVLTRRTPFPAREEWQQWVGDPARDSKAEAVAGQIAILRELEKSGAEILILSADTADYEGMQRVFQQAVQRFGHLDGVFHCAGTVRHTRKGIGQTDQNFCRQQFQAKVYGPLVLDRIFREMPADAPRFCLLVSSLATILGGIGLASYAAANLFMDTFVSARANRQHHEPGDSQGYGYTHWIGVNIEGWNFREEPAVPAARGADAMLIGLAIKPEEGINVFQRLFLLGDLNRVVVSTADLSRRIERWVEREALAGEEQPGQKNEGLLRARPALLEAYTAPRTPLEKKLAEMWQAFFGIDKIGIHDNFFEIGGDSLKGMTLVNQYKKLLGEMVYVQAVFDAPTIAQLAVFFTEHFPGAVAAALGDEAGNEEESLYPREKVNAGKVEAVRRVLPVSAPWAPLTGPKLKPAIFILSPTRSGSTLLRVMLGGHPRLFAPPELNLLSVRTINEVLGSVESEIRAVMQIQQCGVEEARRLMKTFEDQQMTTREFYHLLQTWLGDQILVDKSPLYAYYPEVLQRAEAEFANPYYIHLVRHPYGMIRSKEEAKLNLIQGLVKNLDVTRYEIAELEWVICHQNILEFLGQVPDKRQYRVRFEDLVKEPHKIMGEICNFLGVEFCQEMVEPYNDKKTRMTDGIHSESMMRGDPKFHTHKTIDPKVADKWKTYFKKDFLGDITWGLVDFFGYERLKAKESDHSYTSLEAVEEREYYPLSSAQKRLYILHQLQPDSVGYNLPRVYVPGGRLDINRLENAFRKIILRHEILRTSFEIVNNEPIQRVHPEVEFDLDYINLKQEKVLEAIVKDFVRPFDLARPPLLRVRVVETVGGDVYLLLDKYHIVSDGLSHRLLLRELAELYQEKELAGLRLQYKDYSQWQNSRQQQEAIKDQENYWLGLFPQEPPLLLLPIDFPRARVPRYRGERLRFHLNRQDTDQLKTAVREVRPTLYMIALSIFNILLARLSGQEDIIIGSPIVGRRHADLDNIMGMFVNTLALRNWPTTEKPFLDFLGEVKVNALKAYENQDYPFEDLVERVVVRRDLSRNPLFDVMFTLRGKGGEVPVTPGLELMPAGIDFNIIDFDLSLFGAETSQGIDFSLEYDADLFKPETIERFADYFKNIVSYVGANPRAALGEIDIATATEKHRLLEEFNDTAVEFPGVRTLSELIEAWGEHTPDSTAVVEGEAGTRRSASITYRELNRRSHHWARRLRERGVGPDILVALMAERCLEAIVGILGIVKAGGAYLPIEPAYPAERIRYMLADSSAAILIKTGNFFNDLAVVEGIETISIDDPELFSSSPPLLHPRPASWVNAPDTSLVYVLYTSGTTGKPRGVMVRHSQLVNAAFAWQREYRLAEMEVKVLQMAGISFDVFSGDLARAFVNGGLLVLCPDGARTDFDALYRLIAKYRVTLLESTPGLIIPFMEYVYQGHLHINLLKLLILGSDSCYVEDFRKLVSRFGAGMRIINSYGVTEATIDTSYYEARLEKIPDSGTVPIGKPMPNMAFYVLNGLGKMQPVGIAGELVIGGKGVSRGYLNNPGLTSKKFTQDFPNKKLLRGVQGGGFLEKNPPGRRGQKLYKTGDRARWTEDGNIEFLGRIDFQVKIRGYRIEPGEIESYLQNHEKIKEVAVLCREDSSNEKYLCAYLVLENEFSIPEVKEYLRAQLPAYMIPAHLVTMAKIPLTANGKIDRKSLPDPVAASRALRYITGEELAKVIPPVWEKPGGVESNGEDSDEGYTLSPKERDLVLKTFNNTRAEFPGDKLLHEVFREAGEKVPHRLAIIAPNRTGQCSYRELNHKANQLARELRTQGVKPGSIVGITVERSLEMVIGVIGILKAGGAYMPVDPDSPVERQRFMLHEGSAGLVLVNHNLGIPGHNAVFIDLDNPRIYRGDSTPLPAAGSPTDLVNILYTSGSTGAPKGVMLENRSYLNLLESFSRLIFLSEHDNSLVLSPIVFDPFGLQLFPSLAKGARAILGSSDELLYPSALALRIEREQITYYEDTPSTFQSLMADDATMHCLKSLKYLVLGGEAISPVFCEKMRAGMNPGAVIYNMYGPTEATIFVTARDITRCDTITIGSPVLNTRIYILGKNNSVLPVGVPGELHIGGLGVGRGYINRVELTAEKFCLRQPGGRFLKKLPPWTPHKNFLALGVVLYKTGDLAKWLPNGEIEFIGRKDFQVKISGMRIEPEEIESCLLGYDDVREAAVVVKENEHKEKYLCALAVSEKTLIEADLRKYLAGKLPHYMIPAIFLQLEKMPLTPNKKINRRVLAALAIQKAEHQDYIKPGNEIEQKLVEIWSGVLHLEKEHISVEASFFELGGHSLRATTTVAQIHKEFNVKVPLAELFKTPTIRSIAGLISAAGWINEAKKDRSQEQGLEEIFL